MSDPTRDGLLARFMAKVSPEPNSGCWLWTASLNWRGYGRLKVNGRMVHAHRFAFEMTKGPIPQNLVIDHLCRTRGCVNPDHMEPVTSAVNTLRGESIVAVNARKSHCKYGHALTPENVYTAGGIKRQCRECGREAVRRRRRRLRAPAARAA